VGEAREGAERGTSFVTRKFGQEISEVGVQVCQELEFLDARKERRDRRTRQFMEDEGFEMGAGGKDQMAKWVRWSKSRLV
jgi:hypothetical protein